MIALRPFLGYGNGGPARDHTPPRHFGSKRLFRHRGSELHSGWGLAQLYLAQPFPLGGCSCPGGGHSACFSTRTSRCQWPLYIATLGVPRPPLPSPTLSRGHRHRKLRSVSLLLFAFTSLGSTALVERTWSWAVCSTWTH